MSNCVDLQTPTLTHWGLWGCCCKKNYILHKGLHMNRTKKYLCTIIMAFILLLTSLNSSSAYAFWEEKETTFVTTVYNDQNGLPTGEANTILQTRDGYIWIGSYGGLIKYDGTTFRNYSLEGAVNSSSIRSLYEDSQGRLWIGTNDKGVIVHMDNEFKTISGPDDHSFLCIRDFVETEDGKIYVSSNSGVARVEDYCLAPIMDEKIYENTVYTLGADSYGRIWCAMDNGVCGLIDEDHSVHLFETGTFFRDYDVYSLACSGNKLYLGSSHNLYAEITLLSDKTTKDAFEVSYHSTNNVLTHNYINISNNGDLLICGLTGLYIKYTDGTVLEFDESDSAYSVNNAIIDYEGDIWLASSDTGVTKYAKGYFYNNNSNAGLENISLNTITKAGEYYYIGSDEKLYICDKNWNQFHNELTEALDGVRVRQAITDSSGNVWFATYSGVFCYNPNTEEINNYNSENGLLSDKVRTIYQCADGNIAAGTQSGISFIGDGKVLSNYGHDEGLTVPSILCFLQTDDGTLYAGSDGGGIYALKEGNITNYGFDDGLEEGVVLRMIENADDPGFFISAGSSLYYWDDTGFRKLDNWSKGAGSVFDMYDKQGYLWVFQNKGILAVNKEQLIHDIPAETITYSDSHGLTGSLNANTWNYLENDEDLYIVTRNGVCVFYFTEIKNSEPKGIINNVTVDDVVYDNPSEITIGSDANRITITFSALSFSGTSTLKMSYMLKGFDTHKTVLDSTHTESLSYTNLPGGDYTFELYIYDSHNPNMKERYTVTIHKEKKLIEIPSFWVFVGLMLMVITALILHLISRQKIKKLEARRKEYQGIVEQSLLTFAKTIDAKDSYTNGHSTRVAMYAREIAKRYGMSDYEQERIYYMGLLHDIGKIGVPDGILNKEDKLTDKEMDIIKTHPAIGGDILADFNAIPGISDGARYHHERYDGTGYCEGKKGEEIPVVARIIGVADTYDAMSSDRCYRKALSTEVIISELENAAGTQLDPEFVAIMLEMINEESVPYKLD
ncbi:MAG: HD domain-containing protein [Lachnospiraceae bacterium]|nr:HD domain-containing protein [Lachnospiraceae bacterium]